MEKILQDLFAILQQQLDCYRQLLEFAREKGPVLVEGKIKELDSIVKKEEVLIFEVGRLEEKRNAIHQALADHFMLSAGDLTAVELEKRVGGENAGNLKAFFEDLSKTLKELELANKTNTDLIENSLEYVNFHLNLLTADNDTPSYDGNDDKKSKQRARIFDQKI